MREVIDRVSIAMAAICFGLIPFIKNKVINYRDLFGIFRLSFLVNIQNNNFEKMVKISQRFHAIYGFIFDKQYKLFCLDGF